jgi:hypothetical protein
MVKNRAPLGSLSFWLSSLKKPMGTRARTGGGKPRKGAMKCKFIMLAVSSSLVAVISGAVAQHTVVKDQELMDKLKDAAPGGLDNDGIRHRAIG